MPSTPKVIRTGWFDYTALDRAISRAELAAFTRSADAPRGLPAHSRTVRAVLLVFTALAVGFIVLMIAIGFDSTADPSFRVTGDVLALVPLVVFPIVIAGSSTYLMSLVLDRELLADDRWLRLREFAAANGLRYTAESTDAGFEGAIFNVGRSRAILDRMTTSSGGYLEFGNYVYETGTARNAEQHSWGLVVLRLDRFLPHMLLDSVANNERRSTNLPRPYANAQRLQLEGDFNSHFTLYCPRDHERDALYVFTPDLMAALVDKAPTVDIEIIDNLMMLYFPKPFQFLDAYSYESIMDVVNVVGRSVAKRARRYFNPRPRAAESGRLPGHRLTTDRFAVLHRLARPATAIVLVISVVAFVLFIWRP